MRKKFLSSFVQTFQLGKNDCVIETGSLARQSTSSLIIHMGGTSVLISVVEQTEEKKQESNFFPLIVNYQERSYSIGRIPGSFFRREGRSGENEILTSRLIDRSLRPAFPEQFRNEIQIIATVVSVNPKINPDILSIIGASAALSISHIPFHGPIGSVRIGYIGGRYILNPSYEDLKESELDLIVSGTEDKILMVEARSSLLKEDIILEAIDFSKKYQKTIIDNINKLSEKIGSKKVFQKKEETDFHLKNYILEKVEKDLRDAYLIPDKKTRLSRIQEIKDKIFSEASLNLEVFNSFQANEIFFGIEKEIVRSRILNEGIRIDGRKLNEIRKIDCRVGVLSRTHGSSLFTRGETQTLVIVTLGNERDAQIRDEIVGEKLDHFILHYNFLPYSVGEIGLVGVPKRREIGHGNLVKRGMIAVMPNFSNFSYTIRVVSEVIESNGSSSMASACGTSLAMMDAGIPIKSAIAGISIGLIKEKENFVILSDILGDEDHFGDMDFKVMGNEEGISALQMDLKINGIEDEILRFALFQAKEARCKILKKMKNAISNPRKSISNFAPRIRKIYIEPHKIKDLIGKGGSTIRSLTEETNSVIDIEDTGEVKISSMDELSIKKTILRIKEITSEVEIGCVYKAKVIRIVDFGLFVSILSNKKEGLVRMQTNKPLKDIRFSNKKVTSRKSQIQIGQILSVKAVDIDRQGRIQFILIR
ncbi:polyribonucleotide nucleotidyltransferase [Candidatus Riesia pediculicola USDA]|uniref:Polyribonucleotide nucleotidyltransferase n=1 Tax=Riesia pediculicola (strain USDA) TaxID=515618 RepID=D4G862_RIEPU|nr:polyribonucleotide nucleotidyltransferase [Candidatus Riesia pediculicola USDA]